MRARPTWLLLITLTIVAACAESEDSSPSGPTIAELGMMFADAICPEAEACFGDFADRVFGEQGCVPVLQDQLEQGEFAYVEDAVDAGRVAYDPTQIDACLQGLQMVGCGFQTARLSTRPACQALLMGTVDEGGDCSIDEECAGEAFCRLQDSCPGTCTALLEDGATCDDDDDCQEGLLCTDDGVCKAPVSSGRACGGSTGEVCEPGELCAGEDEDAGTPGTCRGFDEVFVGNEGEGCSLEEFTLCKAGLSCVVSLGAGNMPSFTCEAEVGSGEACNLGAPDPCPDDEYCGDTDPQTGDFEGTCTPLPVDGEACRGEDDDPRCAPDHLCDGDGSCVATGGDLGDFCLEDDDCRSDHCDANECMRPPRCAP
ncbi:MAG: hypothetical protein PVI30_21615 [Myxococcales bacterium]